MVDLCPVVKWSGILMVGWKPDRKSLFMVQNVQYLNDPASHMTTIWILYTQYSDKSGIRVSSIQMVTVFNIQRWCDNRIGAAFRSWRRPLLKAWWRLEQLWEPENWTKQSAIQIPWIYSLTVFVKQAKVGARTLNIQIPNTFENGTFWSLVFEWSTI